MHLVADENWAVTMAEYRKGTATTSFLFGGGVCIQLAWCLGTLTGHRLSAVVQHPELYALDFAPWLVAAVSAIVANQFLPGKWYIVIGGISGALVQTFFQTQTEPASAPQMQAVTERGIELPTEGQSS
jgi:predicted branched-subunit amino acid permease